MNIAINAKLLTTPEWGGQQNYLHYLLLALAKIDSDNQYTVYLPCSPVRPLKLPDNFKIKITKPGWGWGQLALARDTWVNPPDVFFSPAHTLPLLRRFNVKTVLTVHDTATEFVRRKFKEDLLLRLATRGADKIIAVSAATKKDIQAKFGIRADKVKVVYEGYDQKVFYPRGEEELSKVGVKYGLKKESRYIFSLSALQPRKNYERLIEAFSQLNLVERISLVIAGGKGWDYESILAAPDKYGVGERVTFLGHVPDEDVPALFSGAQVFAYPSLYEGFGLPVLEALACGVPVVTSNTSSLPEVIGEAGIKVDPYSVESIRTGLEKALGLSLEARAELVEKGFRQVKKFSWEKTARETLEIFKQLKEKS